MPPTTIPAQPDLTVDQRRAVAASLLDDARKQLIAAQAALDCSELRSVHVTVGNTTIPSLDDARGALVGG